MIRKRIENTANIFPDTIKEIINGGVVYDSSCSSEATVYYIEKENGFFVKHGRKGALDKEAKMTDYFHTKGLSAKVLKYISDESDWLITEKVSGEDCICKEYLSDPKRLCDITAEKLRMLHSIDFSDCPIQNRNEIYINTAIENYRSGNYDKTHFPDSFGYADAESAIDMVLKNKHRFKSDVLLHGDYCLPNIMLDNWKFSGFIDLGNGGVGDRHIDLFWGAWTLNFNFNTEQYRERFFDAYGRQDIDFDMLRVIAAFEVFG